MPLSAIAERAVQATSSDAAILELIEIDHPQLEEPVRVVANHEDIVSGGVTYVGYPVEVMEPDDDPESPAMPVYRIDNVSDKFATAISALLAIGEKPKITLRGVLSTNPDVMERGPIQMKLQNCDEDLHFVTAQISVFDFLDEGVPGDTFNPGTHPALSWGG